MTRLLCWPAPPWWAALLACLRALQPSFIASPYHFGSLLLHLPWVLCLAYPLCCSSPLADVALFVLALAMLTESPLLDLQNHLLRLLCTRIQDDQGDESFADYDASSFFFLLILLSLSKISVSPFNDLSLIRCPSPSSLVCLLSLPFKTTAMAVFFQINCRALRMRCTF